MRLPAGVGWPKLAQMHSLRNSKQSASGTTVCDMTEPLLTADEVAAMLGVPASWVYEQSRAGRIPTVTLGRYRRYRRQAIEAWLEQLESTEDGHRNRAA